MLLFDLQKGENNPPKVNMIGPHLPLRRGNM
jgi:hypothetical protein